MSNQPLDEIQWRAPQIVAAMPGGIHSNTVLYYFAESPFFDRMSNNAVLVSQGNYMPNIHKALQSRDTFEARLKTMSGLEFIVAQEPAETNPNAGTGVWVIHKQTRRKRPKHEDEVTIHAAYYIIGDSVFMAPTMADILTYRMSSIAAGLSKTFPTANSARTWSPSVGHKYRQPAPTNQVSKKAFESRGVTPLPESQSQATKNGNPVGQQKKSTTDSALEARLLERTIGVHMQFGGEYMDDNPITGVPGNFHLSSTGRREMSKLQLPIHTSASRNPVSSTASSTPGSTVAGKKDEKGPKTPKTPAGSLSKPKRKKTKSAAATPTAS
ncbi:mediator of RNA polymerase II transcription subunit 6 [Microdochium nivale]|nr:mediator of RNA polymerase II transcription subunit 6 [Microdochium nivale]